MQHPRRTILRLTVIAILATSFLVGIIATAHAEATEARISRGHSTLYPPIVVMVSEHLLEE